MNTALPQAALLGFVLLMQAACSSSDDDASSPTAGTTEGTTEGTTGGGEPPALEVSCEAISASQLQNTSGVISTVLPADLSVAGAQIAIQVLPEGQLASFDAQTGAVDYVPGASRLSTEVSYQVIDANDNVLASHKHQWVVNPVRVMPLGDSITAGVEFFDGSNDLPPQALRVGYRKFLYDRLSQQGYAVDFQGQGGQSAGADAGLVDPENNGYPGVDIDFLNAKLNEQLAEDNVDIILLHIGTNNTPADAAGIDQWLDALDVWEATNNPVIALVATIVPERDATRNAQTDVFNNDLRQRIAARTNDRVVLVEQNLALTLDDISTEAIGVHPNIGGYEKMANVWFDALIDSGALKKCDAVQ